LAIIVRSHSGISLALTTSLFSFGGNEMLSGIVVFVKAVGPLAHTRAFAALLITSVLLLGQSPMVLAHGGEDHGDQKPVAPAAGQMNTKLAKAEGFEVLVKYPTPKPAEDTLLRVFVTDSKTNAPIAGVNVAMVLNLAGKTETATVSSFGVVHADSNAAEAVATPTDTPGIYEAHVVFPEVGQYNIALRLAGANINQEMAITGVAVPARVTASNGSRAFPVTLIILFSLLLISLTAAAYLMWLRPRTMQGRNAVASTYTEAREHEA
jgi:hypothetical protein